MGSSPPKPLHLVLLLTAIAATFFFFLFYSQLVDDPTESRSNTASRSITIATTSAGTQLRVVPHNGGETQVGVVSGEDNAGGHARSIVVETFRVLLGLKSPRPRPIRAGALGEVLAPAPAPMAAAPAPARDPHRPARSYSNSPLPRPSRIPPVEDAQLRRGGSSRAKALWIAAAAAVSAGATLAIVALTVVLVRHRKRRGRAPSAGAAMDKVVFDPRLELLYLDTFAPGLAEQLTGAERSSHSEAGSTTPSGSPASSPARAGESDEDESFHSFSICNSHPSPLRASDASEGSEPAQPCETPPPAFAPPFPLKPPSSPPPGLGFGRRVTFSTEVSLSRPPLKKVASAAKSSSGVHGGGLPCSSPSSSIASSSSSFPGSSLRMDSQTPVASPCMESSSSVTTAARQATPPSSSSSNTAIGSSSVNPEAKRIQLEEPKHTAAMASVSNGDAPHPPPPPLATPLRPPPPPPPPPSFRKGGSPRPVPPPPRQLPPTSSPVGKDGSPLPKLKALHWDKVRATPDRSMVWDKIRSSSFELDEEMIESLFGYNLQGSGRSEEARSKASSPSKHVLEPKRLQNFTILLKALNATSDQVCGALLRGSGLSAQQLEALSKMVPTKEEERLLCFEGDVGELDAAERFVREVLSIPFSFPRIEVMLYRETFEDEVAHLRKSFQTLEEACKELRSSRLFLRLLEAVLKTGNRMNVGTIRGGARAFKLDALLKLADVKGTDGKTNLLHFVVQEIVRSEGATAASTGAAEKAEDLKQQQCPKRGAAEEKEDDYRAMGLELVSGLGTELRHVKTAAGVDLDAVASSVANLSAGLQKVQLLLQRHELHADLSQGGFLHSMRSFSSYAGRTIKELEEDEGQVFRLVREITEYYHGDVGKEEANPLGIFVIVRDFLGMLERVCREVGSWKVHHSPTMAVPFVERRASSCCRV